MTVQLSWSYSPTWLEQGTYAKYGAPPYVSRWECLSVEGDVARLSVSFFHSVNLSTIVNVNTETREVTLLNGSAFGKTLLWLPANSNDGETIDLNGEAARVEISGSFPPETMNTPQGAQRIFSLINWNIQFVKDYDLDTGLLISGSPPAWSYESTIKALGIRSSWISLKDLSDTNIDLGPRELWPEIGRYLIFAPFIAVFIVVPIFILRRRQKRSRMMQRLRKPKATPQEPIQHQ